MTRKMSLIMYEYIFVLFFGYVATDFGTMDADNYGPYNVEWEHYDQCRGPKSTNLTEYITKLTKMANGDFNAHLNLTILDITRIDEMKISVFTIKDNAKTLLWNYFINQPCQHYVFATLISTQLGVKNCAVKKGVYVLDMNLTELMVHYIGKSFFYGNYLFKVVVTSKKGNIVCLLFDPSFNKIK